MHSTVPRCPAVASPLRWLPHLGAAPCRPTASHTSLPCPRVAALWRARGRLYFTLRFNAFNTGLSTYGEYDKPLDIFFPPLSLVRCRPHFPLPDAALLECLSQPALASRPPTPHIGNPSQSSRRVAAPLQSARYSAPALSRDLTRRCYLPVLLAPSLSTLYNGSGTHRSSSAGRNCERTYRTVEPLFQTSVSLHR